MNFGDLQIFGCVHKILVNKISDYIYLASETIKGMSCAVLPTTGDMNSVFLMKGIPLLWRNTPTRAQDALLLVFLNHTHTRTRARDRIF